MTIVEAKPVMMNWATNILNVWFPKNPIMQALGKQALENVWGKYESTIELLLTDKDGNLTVSQFIDQAINGVIPANGISIGDLVGSDNKMLSLKLLERQDLVQLKNLLQQHGTL
jgi:hypothetical protein